MRPPTDVRSLTNPFTGLFTTFGVPQTRAQDPGVPQCAGSLPPWGPQRQVVYVGGAGWTETEAAHACLGEAIERVQSYPLSQDTLVRASFRGWHEPEPALPPESWVLFHPEQYASEGFPFPVFDADSLCRWVAFRDAGTGEVAWIPEELGFLFGHQPHRISPSISTGLSCGRWGQPVLLRGLQEVIERDAIIGAWWGRYDLQEWPAESVFAQLGADTGQRCPRPNLAYRFYRVDSPFSAHVTIVTIAGTDREGWLFSAGAACRETRRQAWQKALLEAVQGWHYVRYLKAQRSASRPDTNDPPLDFADHAVYYSLHPERLERTPLGRARPAPPEVADGTIEGLSDLRRRLGADRRVLFRNVTPPAVAASEADWYVLKVVVPGLQPMHGHHGLPHLGGPLWAPRGLAEWSGTEPHPFP